MHSMGSYVKTWHHWTILVWRWEWGAAHCNKGVVHWGPTAVLDCPGLSKPWELQERLLVVPAGWGYSPYSQYDPWVAFQNTQSFLIFFYPLIVSPLSLCDGWLRDLNWPLTNCLIYITCKSHFPRESYNSRRSSSLSISTESLHILEKIFDWVFLLFFFVHISHLSDTFLSEQ